MDSVQKCFLFFMLLLPALCSAEDAYLSTKATFYGSTDVFFPPFGACGYGEYGITVNNGEVCGVSKLYRNGTGCGACYQVRCTYEEHCTEEGTTVVATDHAAGYNSEIILSGHAYAKLARPNQEAVLYAAGVIDVEYKRVPCKYQANLMIKVHEHSYYPHYLAVVVLFQGGAYDITAVEVYEESSKKWKPMRKTYGAIWDMFYPPKGYLAFRFQVCGSSGGTKWVKPNRVLPSEWKAGVAYDTAFQLT